MPVKGLFVFLSLIIIIKLAIYPITAHCQTTFKAGAPFIKNYSAEEINSEGSEFFCCAQDNRGMVYFGNITGITEFNGREWKQIHNANHTIVRGMATDSLGRIYTGASKDFGYLQPDSMGNMEFVSLAKPVLKQGIHFQDIWGVYSTPYGIYFCSNNYAFQYAKNNISVIPVDFKVQDAYVIDKQLYLPTQEGIYTLIDTVMSPVSEKLVFCLTSWKKNQCLTIANKYELAVFNISSSEITPFDSPVQKILKEDHPFEIQRIDEDYFLVTTFNNKIIILNNYGDIIQIIDRGSGLMKGTIYHVHVDRDKNLWACMSDGIAKIDINYPVLKFDECQNVTCNVNATCVFKSMRYIGTMNGIYYLPPFNSSDIDDRDRFTKIEINATECWEFLIHNKKLYALCSEGLWEVEGTSAKYIYSVQAPKRAWRMETNERFPNVFFIALKEGFMALELDNKGEKTKTVHEFQFPDIKHKITKITSDKEGNLWLNTVTEGVYFIQFKNSNLSNCKTTLLGNQNGISSLDYTKCYNINNNIILSTADGIFQAHLPKNASTTDTLIKFTTSTFLGDSIIDFHPKIVALNNKKYLIKGNNFRFVDLNQNTQISEYSILDRITSSISSLSSEGDSIINICSYDGLYNYYLKTDLSDYKKPFNTIISKVVQDGDSLLFGGCFYETGTNSTKVTSTVQSKKDISTIEHNFSSITFHVSALFYEAPELTEFQYQLSGYDKKWSNWSTDNKVTYTRLPFGEYIFKVKARNVYGTLSTSEFKFIVTTPWFHAWWAYVFYTLVFAGLLYLVVMLYTHKLRKQKELLELTVEERTQKIKKQANELQEMNAKLIEVGKFKQGVNNMIVHDMKNPISAIINFSELGESGELTEDNLFSVIKYAGLQLLNMVSNILDVSKYEDTEIPLNVGKHQLYGISEKAIGQVLFLCDKKNVVVENRIPPNLIVNTDEELVERIFVNMLTNAVKFSPNNSSVIIHSEISQIAEQNKDFARITITDHGIGIAKEKIPLLFRKFSQVTRCNSGKVKSSGLGLAFCKMAVEAHGGEIGVQSEPNKGSVFWFTLPTTMEDAEVQTDEKQTDVHTPFKLSATEKRLIEEQLKELKKSRFYEISEIVGILNRIEDKENHNIREWKQKLEDAVKSGNELLYKELIDEGI